MFKINKNAFENRIHEIDFFRGLLILLVIFDHLMWFINFYIFKNQQPFINWYWSSNLRYVIRQIVLMLFLFTCGISCHLSKNNAKRGLILLLFVLLIPLITHIIQCLPIFNGRIIVIDFNILGVIALSILFYVIFEKSSNKDLLLSIIILVIIYIGVLIGKEIVPVYEYNPLKSIMYLNFNPIKEGYVGDYLPLFPYIIFLPLGALFARIFYKDKKSLLKRKNFERPICFLGRRTLIIYIGHEILFSIIFILIGALI